MCYLVTKKQLRAIVVLGVAICLLSFVSSAASLWAIHGFAADQRDREDIRDKLAEASAFADTLLQEARALQQETDE